MGYLPKKTLEDLEFFEVTEQISDFAITPMGKASCIALEPMADRDTMLKELHSVSEYLASFDNDNRIPNHGFEDLSPAFRLLKIENSVLEITAFRNIAAASHTVNTLLVFLNKFKTYYPSLLSLGSEIEINKEIKKEIDSVIDRFGEVRDNASENLYNLRKQIQALKGKISQSFNKALSHYQNLDYLDDIRESVVENKRVLAVKAMYRRKVKGGIMGSSKTGSIVFIEPEATLNFSRELQNLVFEESEEIKKILSQLTEYLRPQLGLIKYYQSYLIDIDTIFARARYAQAVNGLLPIFSDQQELELKNAYHPLLYRTHQLENKKTFPQDIHLHTKSRIVVISGPNAGGKSITLKTVGLLQLMLQSGILIPVHEKSRVCWFDRILTDIGDNQSIENHLSTYSYRLKNMKGFLKKCDDKTLFLIDEFGTGSDPELGGALAEVILEDFYERQSFGLITTHYANLKLLADEQPGMINANMQFDDKTLEPVFKLILGEAGSSFTFEVAQKNGIPFSLINRAKKKIERGKVRFDATIAKMQKERYQMAQTGKSLKEKENKFENESDRLEKLNEKLKSKLVNYQELFDHNQRMIVLGNKLNDLAERFFQNNKKRPMIADLLRLIEAENAKRKRKTAAQAKKDREVKKEVAKEVNQKLVSIRKEKKKNKTTTPPPKPKPVIDLKVGDKVRMVDGKSVGSIDAIEKQKAIVNYGLFTTQVSLDQLEIAN
ncbi:MAG: DNA mismatch repair protein MutS [Bacteroidota bacterium]|nr:DNA mismatch repair protein MutS [Bacteroidota bacterium]MEC9135242.1 DNA mismatch repair protein MutS [Bacteroidota bacterium]